MIDGIVYCSNTGFTKQYAYSFAVKTGLPIYSLKESKKLPKESNIIYFSWLRNSSIVNLKKVKHNIVKVCAVGMAFYSTEYIDQIKQKNNLEDLYYLQGGLRMYKLSLPYRFIMNRILKRILKKGNHLTIEEQMIADSIKNNNEYIDLDSLNILIDWYNNTINYVC